MDTPLNIINTFNGPPRPLHASTSWLRNTYDEQDCRSWFSSTWSCVLNCWRIRSTAAPDDGGGIPAVAMRRLPPQFHPHVWKTHLWTLVIILRRASWDPGMGILHKGDSSGALRSHKLGFVSYIRHLFIARMVLGTSFVRWQITSNSPIKNFIYIYIYIYRFLSV